MKIEITGIYILFICFIFLSTNSWSQTDKLSIGQYVSLELEDGSVITGHVISIDSTTLRIETLHLGITSVSYENIVEIETPEDFEALRDSKGYLLDYHNSTHYTLSPSAYSLKKGQIYYENLEIILNSVSYGLTDNIDITVGAEVISFLVGKQFPAVFISPKFTFFNSDKGAMAINYNLILVPNADAYVHYVSGIYTVGNRNNNFSIGAGLMRSTDENGSESGVPLTISTMLRMGPRMSFVSENWFFLNESDIDYPSLLTAGFRFHLDKPGTAFNAGLWRPFNEYISNIIALPYVSTTIKLK